MSPTSYRTAPPRAKLTRSQRLPTTERLMTSNSQPKIGNQKSKMPLVGLGRVELPTSRLSGVRSNQLSYRPLVSFALNVRQTSVCRARVCRVFDKLKLIGHSLF